MAIYTPLGVRLTGYCRQYPEPPQEAFLALGALEALYGGAAGGGKSSALLTGALQYVDVPGYAAILFRRTYPELYRAGGLVDRSKEWLRDTDATWNENARRWTFPSGALIEFGHLQRVDDVYDYGSTEYQYLGFDELTEFTERQWRFLLSRLRRPSDPEDPLSHVPLRARGASNPGGIGHRWVKRRFIDPDVDSDDPEDTPKRRAARIFIPARLHDNPHVDQDQYLRALRSLDPQTRAQLLDGDWNARPPGDWVFPKYLDDAFAKGAEFDRLRDEGKMPPPVGDALILSADWGVNSHLLLLWPLEGGGFYAVREFVYQGNKVRALAEPVANAIAEHHWRVYEERFDASMPGLNETFLEALEQHLPRPKWLAVPFNKYKLLSVLYLQDLVNNVGTGEVAPILAVSPIGCPVLAEQLRGWRYADPDSGRIEKGDDHGPDALVAGVAPQAAKRRSRGSSTPRIEDI